MEILKAWLDVSVMGILGLMSFVTVWMAVERMLFYRKVDLASFTTEEELRIELTNNLTMISTIGSNAPYVGLLGTVFGIMLTFYEIGDSGALAVGEIMKGLAMALKATALGLAVAIPAIIAYNGLMRRADSLSAIWVARRGR